MWLVQSGSGGSAAKGGGWVNADAEELVASCWGTQRGGGRAGRRPRGGLGGKKAGERNGIMQCPCMSKRGRKGRGGKPGGGGGNTARRM